MRRGTWIDKMNHSALVHLLDDAATFSSDHLSLRVGIDRVEIETFAQLLTSGGDAFLSEVFRPDEITYCSGRVERLAARFCAKEAALKVLGTGIRGVALGEVEVVHAANGQPTIVLLERADERATALKVASLAVSMTHTKFAAEAVVVALLDAQLVDFNLERRITDGQPRFGNNA